MLEYVENGALSDMLRKQKNFTASLTRFYAAELILALEYVHQRKIAHRDLKPDNILISADYHLKLTDFGQAKKFVDESVTVTEQDPEDEEYGQDLFDD